MPTWTYYTAQNSQLDASRIEFVGNVAAWPERVLGTWQYYVTTSSLATDFTISEPHSYEATVTADGSPWWGYQARLISLTEGVIVYSGTASSGVLPAGTYRLEYEVYCHGLILPPGETRTMGWGSLTAHLALAVGDNQACCFSDGTCQDLPAADCGAAGGTAQGFASSCAAGNCGCPCDASGDGLVGLADIAAVLAAWGQASPPAASTADVDGDGTVGLGDVAKVIGRWGAICP
ncbi:MAG TPA: hypothetical protein VG797_03205 [Phycisphaerales bacterium]|nr:hypothetical protein [Phycisphaerales bacterium]